MSQLFAPLDDALGGVSDAIEGATDTAGDATGNVLGGVLGGVFGGLGNWLLKMAALAVVGYALVQVVA
jgi:hypothetical protein